MNATTTYRAVRVQRLGVDAGIRATRIVGDLEGILDDVHPDELGNIGGMLWNAWLDHQAHTTPDLLLGVHSGGILPTVAVALASGLPYRLVWKVDLDLPNKCAVVEPHARRTKMCTYGDLTGRRVLLIDDEITTGHTLAELIFALHNANVEVAGVACLVEDIAASGRALLDILDVPLCVLTTLRP